MQNRVAGICSDGGLPVYGFRKKLVIETAQPSSAVKSEHVRAMKNPETFTTAVLSLFFLVAGCDEAESIDADWDAESDASDGALRINGEVDFGPGCTPSEQGRISDAMGLITASLESSDDYLECVKSAVLTADDGATAEELVERLRENMPTSIECSDVVCNDPNTAGCAGVGIPTEDISLQRSYLLNADIESIAGLIVHEVGHNKGLGHPGTWFEPDSRFRAIRQLQECMRADEPAGLARDAAEGDTELARVGGEGGSPFELACPGGHIGRGLVVDSSSSYVNRLALRCDVSTTGSVGRFRDSIWSRNRTCPAGEVLVGVKGRAGSILGRLSMICADEDDVVAEQMTVGAQRWVGGNSQSGTDFERRCPAGMAVKRLRGRSGSRIDQLRVGCEAYPVSARGQNELQPVVGTTTGSPIEDHCMGFGVLTGIWGSSGGAVDRLGGRCLSTVSNFWGVPDLDDDAAYQSIEAVGGEGGNNFDDSCPTGQAVVGLRARTGSLVGRVQAICSDVSQWSSTSGTPAISYTPYRGTGGGTTTNQICPQGKFVVGMRTWASKTVHATPTVNGFAPVCRRVGFPMVASPWW